MLAPAGHDVLDAARPVAPPRGAPRAAGCTIERFRSIWVARRRVWGGQVTTSGALSWSSHLDVEGEPVRAPAHGGGPRKGSRLESGKEAAVSPLSGSGWNGDWRAERTIDRPRCSAAHRASGHGVHTKRVGGAADPSEPGAIALVSKGTLGESPVCVRRRSTSDLRRLPHCEGRADPARGENRRPDTPGGDRRARDDRPASISGLGRTRRPPRVIWTVSRPGATSPARRGQVQTLISAAVTRRGAGRRGRLGARLFGGAASDERCRVPAHGLDRGLGQEGVDTDRRHPLRQVASRSSTAALRLQ